MVSQGARDYLIGFCRGGILGLEEMEVWWFTQRHLFQRSVHDHIHHRLTGARIDLQHAMAMAEGEDFFEKRVKTS